MTNFITNSCTDYALATFGIELPPLAVIETDNIDRYIQLPYEGPGGSMSQVVGLANNSYKPITNTAWVRAWLCKLQKGCTRLSAASDKAYQLLAHGRWFSPGTPTSSTTKTGSHDITEILLKVALNTKNKQINQTNYHMITATTTPLVK